MRENFAFFDKKAFREIFLQSVSRKFREKIGIKKCKIFAKIYLKDIIQLQHLWFFRNKDVRENLLRFCIFLHSFSRKNAKFCEKVCEKPTKTFGFFSENLMIHNGTLEIFFFWSITWKMSSLFKLEKYLILRVFSIISF